jgi:hypothetical protein
MVVERESGIRSGCKLTCRMLESEELKAEGQIKKKTTSVDEVSQDRWANIWTYSLFIYVRLSRHACVCPSVSLLSLVVRPNVRWPVQCPSYEVRSDWTRFSRVALLPLRSAGNVATRLV